AVGEVEAMPLVCVLPYNGELGEAELDEFARAVSPLVRMPAEERDSLADAGKWLRRMILATFVEERVEQRRSRIAAACKRGAPPFDAGASIGVLAERLEHARGFNRGRHAGNEWLPERELCRSH